MFNILILSRKKAEELSEIDFASNKAVISISTPGDEPANIHKNASILGVLKLQFADCDNSDKTMYPENWIFSDEQAKNIYDFIMSYKDKIECLWIHCDGGISRSAGVGAAILKALTGDDSSIFEDKKYCPNMLVYRKILNAFQI